MSDIAITAAKRLVDACIRARVEAVTDETGHVILSRSSTGWHGVLASALLEALDVAPLDDAATATQEEFVEVSREVTRAGETVIYGWIRRGKR